MAIRKKSPAKSVKKTQVNVPLHYKPAELSIEKWQIALRRQFVETKTFGIEKIDGLKSPFGDYAVRNPETKNAYKVAFRGLNSPMNFCSCLDFKTNRLGTCKHLEALIFQLKNDPNTPDINREYEPNYTSFYLSYKNGREVKIRVGNICRYEFEELAEAYFDNNYTLLPESYDQFEDILEKAKAIDSDFRCYDDALEFVLETREHKLRQKIAVNCNVEDLLNASLFPYQQEGIRFAFEAGRSLNADEMGLGKTIQAIGASQMFRKEQGIEKVLIICPTSLKYQWQSEIKKFSGENAFVIEGSPRIRKNQYERDDFYKIVSYHTVSNDIKEIVAQDF
ncbi:MAG: SNF2-related protein, partial [Candidatus Azobacteroides sp.]|nr:SNF2-related protein [Candidatus Azobacteroides sp.]